MLIAKPFHAGVFSIKVQKGWIRSERKLLKQIGMT